MGRALPAYREDDELIPEPSFPKKKTRAKKGSVISLDDFRSKYEKTSIIQRLVDLYGPRRFYSKLSQQERIGLLYLWDAWARPEQIAPAWDWFSWIYLAGRGSGKTRSGAEWIRQKVDSGIKRIALIAATVSDYRDTMIEGESGILAISPPWNQPVWEPSKRKLTWPNGAKAYCFSAEKPDRLRGPQFEAAWADEMASWARLEETYDNLMFGLRLGDHPQLMITTTPRPLKILKRILADKNTASSLGSTYDNIRNLSPRFVQYVLSRYEGTRLGRQEIHAEILEDNPDALFKRENLERDRVRPEDVPPLEQVVIPVDPAASSGEKADDTGIVPVGKAWIDGLEHFYLLDDHTCHLPPGGWGREVLKAFHIHDADRIVGEVNNGGEMVEHVIKTCQIKIKNKSTGESEILYGRNLPFKSVHASRGKKARAEPVAALSEQGRLHIVGNLPEVEDELCEWTDDDPSPDRMDSAVWGVSSMLTHGVRIYAA